MNLPEQILFLDRLASTAQEHSFYTIETAIIKDIKFHALRLEASTKKMAAPQRRFLPWWTAYPAEQFKKLMADHLRANPNDYASAKNAIEFDADQSGVKPSTRDMYLSYVDTVAKELKIIK